MDIHFNDQSDLKMSKSWEYYIRKIYVWRGLPWIVYSCVSLIVLWDLLLPGYILTLDMQFARHIRFEHFFYGFATPLRGTLPFIMILKALNYIFPTWIIQKALLFLIFVLAGLSAHRLCPTDNLAGKYYAGLFYALNPFVFVRFMVGHLLILMAYAIMPLAAKAGIDFLKQTSFHTATRLVILLTLVGMFSAEILLLTLFLIFAILAFRAIRKRTEITHLLKWTGIVAVMFLGVNFYWLGPAALGVKETSLSLVSYEDLLVFTAKMWGVGPNLFFSLATLHGFWRPPEGYVYISDMLPGWFLVYFFLLFLSVYGFMSRRETEDEAKSFAIVAIVSLILATGISTAYFSKFFLFLFENFFFLKAFRDSHKFVVLLALAYSFLGGLGVGELASALKRRSLGRKENSLQVKKALGILLIFLVLAAPFIYSANMLFGLGNNLKVVDYPEEWYEVNEYFKAQEEDFKVLFLPWHQYMWLTWVGRIVGNPADIFFDKPIIRGKNIEVGPIETQSTELDQRYIHFLLNKRDQLTNFGELMAPLNVKYIILVKEVDYKDYDFLYKQKDLAVVIDNSHLTLFENLHETHKFYTVDDEPSFQNWNQLLDHSFRQVEAKPVKFEKVSPAEYRVWGITGKYLIFAQPFDGGWRFNGRPPKPYMDLTNVFEVKGENEGRIYYENMNFMFTAYSISATSCFIVLMLSIVNRKRK